ncbi:uncharacterized protein LOC144431328 [Styela clava]
MPKSKKVTALHVAILGDKSVGKYSLREQFIKGWIAPKDFEAPPGPSTKTLVVNGTKVKISVSCHHDLQNSDISSWNGVILLYNISQKNSLEYIPKEAVPCLQTSQNGDNTTVAENGQGNETNNGEKSIKLPTVLVGNKADEAKLSRNVEVDEGKKLSSELGCVGFFETSATCNENVTKSFETLIQKMLEDLAKIAPEKKTKPKSKCIIS